jgi:2-methylisocitrate lyase-like PEP mutase family enzyme
MKAAPLKTLLRRPGAIPSLGVHDVFTALAAEQAGMPLLFLGGFGATASHLGQPDLSLITLTEMADLVRRITQRVSVPLIADGDTGHGGLHNVAQTVRAFERAGAAGVILEDQVFPKRCGHFSGKSVIPAPDMVAKLMAARSARKSSSFILVARTDARDVLGFSEAVRRVKLYKKAGADVVFIESPHTEDELALIPKKVKAPVLANMLTGGKTPNVPLRVLSDMGYKIVVYPVESLMILADGIQRLSRAILNDGTVDAVRARMSNFSQIKTTLGLEQYLNHEKSNI